MIKVFFLFLAILQLTNCSFDTKSGFWTKQKKIENKLNEKFLFQKNEINKNEFNQNLIVKLGLNTNKNNINNGNNIGVSKLNNELKNISKYKFKKIKYFDQFEPEITFFNNDLIFFDSSGSVIRFNENAEIIWKVNYYTKKEKKNNPILKITREKNKILITDSFSKIYLINLNDGSLIWSTDHNVNFISEIKIDGNRIYALDASNVFNCFSLINGELIWDFKGENQLINSQKQKSIVYDSERVIFNNTQNKIVALSKFSGNLIWITPTITFDEGFQSYLIDNSEIVLDNNNLYFSNEANNFFSLDVRTGSLKWAQKVKSSLKPIIIDNVIFTISSNRYLNILDKNDGSIIRITDIFKNLKKKIREKIEVTGFIVAEKKIFVSTNLGYLLLINISDGAKKNLYRISREKISEPYINNNNLYLIKNNEIIKMN